MRQHFSANLTETAENIISYLLTYILTLHLECHISSNVYEKQEICPTNENIHE